MWPYWLFFIVPACAAIVLPGRAGCTSVYRQPLVKPNHVWFLVGLTLTFVIGLRFEVGGDWWNYLNIYESLRSEDFFSILSRGDPGYRFVEWFSLQLHWGIFGVNFIGAALFTVGLIFFCRALPRPWLALAISVPYLVIVVAMGYTRQGVAIGLGMLGLVSLGRQSVRGFVAWVLLAATFHKSAVLLLPIAALAATRRRVWISFWIVVVTLAAYVLFLADSVAALQHNYLEAGYQSAGALVRLLMNAVPAVLLLLFRRRFEMTFAQYRLWFWCSVISLGLLAILFVSPSSTAVDRVALLLLPLQVAVFSYVPEVFGGKGGRNNFFTTIILIYYATVQFVWLNFAVNVHGWIPYRFYPLVGMF